MGKHKSIIKQSIDRLDQRMAIGESRFEAKQAIRQANPQSPQWTISDNKIHSYGSRSTYQQHSLNFVTWAREAHHIRQMEQLDRQRHELVNEYLQQQLDRGASPYTLQTKRASLRMFFADRSVGESVAIPKRSRENISRSRHQVIRDKGLSQARNEDLITFLRSTGLRRSEVRDLRSTDVYQAGTWYEITVRNGKGGKSRQIVAMPEANESIKRVLERDNESGMKLFERIPSHMDVHSLRREYAQQLYMRLSGRELPPAQGRLKKSEYDAAAVMEVSKALGHNRLDVVLNHYLR